MFSKLPARDRVTYIVIACIFAFVVGYSAISKLRPVGPAEIHGIPSGSPSSNTSSNTAEPRAGASIEKTSSSNSDERGAAESTSDAMDQPPTAPITTSQPEPTTTNPPANADETPSLAWLNTADSDQLQTLPGIGQKLATAIITYREANGPFPTLASLRQVKGLGEKRVQKIIEFLNNRG